MLTGKSGVGTIEVEIDKSQDVGVSVREDGQGIHPKVEPYFFQWLPNTSVPKVLLKINVDLAVAMGRKGGGLQQLKSYVQEGGGTIGNENGGTNYGARF